MQFDLENLSFCSVSVVAVSQGLGKYGKKPMLWEVKYHSLKRQIYKSAAKQGNCFFPHHVGRRIGIDIDIIIPNWLIPFYRLN